MKLTKSIQIGILLFIIGSLFAQSAYTAPPLPDEKIVISDDFSAPPENGDTTANLSIDVSRDASIDKNLVTAIEEALIKYLNYIPADGIIISNVINEGRWVFGTIAIVAPDTKGAGPEGVLFLAQQIDGMWKVSIEHTTQFKIWVTQTPDQLIPQEEKTILSSSGSTRGNGAAQLSLPWATGETWRLTGGPHHNSGYNQRPWSALDFAVGGGQVRAARDGIAYLDCANFIRINHADGWQTGYYHINNIGSLGISVGNKCSTLNVRFFKPKSQHIVWGFLLGTKNHGNSQRAIIFL